jgi:23S rRNA (uracil1939-C5)-methyltransferase
MLERITVEKLVHGGQGIGTLADGRRVFLWNALPGEEVAAEIVSKKRNHAEGIAQTVYTASPERIEPVDEAYLSTSPWQIMTYAAENHYKQQILTETLLREHVALDDAITFHAPQEPLHYRNKMEYSFWADDNGLQLALFNRGSHGKRVIGGSSIAMPAIDIAANAVLSILTDHNIRGSQLKTVMLRASQSGEVAIALFVKDDQFPILEKLAETAQGVAVYYSTPKSPASVVTQELYHFGETKLTDALLDRKISYDVTSFFQVNVPIFEQALKSIRTFLQHDSYVDMYSGVGSIGLALGGAAVLVESDPANCRMAVENAAGTDAKVIQATAETALEHISGTRSLIVDPPRAGLHSKVVNRILAELPPKIAYLSCNPITLGRDLALLSSHYHIASLTGFNFFPRTPHIEALATLVKK